jgi:DNA-binding CsgD family transcriptional regulator
VLARLGRSLRLAGHRRSAPRSTAAGTLTARERELLALAASGLSNGEIARQLGVSRTNVARLIASAARKLGAETRLQAAALAARQ